MSCDRRHSPATSRTELRQQLDANRQRVDVDHYDIISALLRMAADDELSIAPVYQRHFRWKLEDRESADRVAVPRTARPFNLHGNKQGCTWEVVDGLQRLSTIMHFVADPPEVLEMTRKSAPLILEGLSSSVGTTESSSRIFPGLSDSLSQGAPSA